MLELRYAEEEHGDGEFAGTECNEDLAPVEVVILEKAGIVVGLEIVAVPSQTPLCFLQDEAQSDRVCHLQSRDMSVQPLLSNDVPAHAPRGRDFPHT